MLLIAGSVLFCRHYSRLLRDRAILELSRDRAQSDLQMITHQRVRARAPMSEGGRSFPESLTTVKDASSVSVISMSGASLPPGPPSSQQEVMHHVPLPCTVTPSAVPAHSEHAASQLVAASETPFAAGGVPPATMGPSGLSSAPRHAISLAPPNRTAPPAPAAPPSKPRCKAAYAKTAYLNFARVTRPLLPTSLRNAEREKVLGDKWRALSATEKASYKVGGAQTSATTASSAPARDMSAAARTVAARAVATAALDDDTHWNAKRSRTTTETTIPGTTRAPSWLLTVAKLPSFAAPNSLALAAPPCPRTTPMPAALTPSEAPCPPASCRGELRGLDVVTEMVEQMTEAEILEASPAPSAAAVLVAAPPAPPISPPALPADLARMFDEPTALAAPPAAPRAPSVALAPTVRPSFTSLATLPAPPAALNAPISSANAGFELLVTHTLEHMTEEEAAEALLGSCL